MGELIMLLEFNNDIVERHFEAREAINDLVKSKSQLVTITNEIDDTLASLQRLRAISNTVSKFGLCRSLMEGSDPYNELVQYKICPVYETLSDTFIKDELSAEVVVNLDKASEGIIDVVKSIINKIKTNSEEARIKDEKLRAKYMAIFKELKDKLTHISTFDDGKFGETETRAFSKAEFDKIVTCLNGYITTAKGVFDDVVKEFDKVVSKKEFSDENFKKEIKNIVSKFKPLDTEDYRGIIGLDVDFKEDGIKISIVEPKLVDKRDKLKSFGWVASDAKKLISKCEDINGHGIDFFNTGNSFERQLVTIFNKLVDEYNSNLKKFKGGDESLKETLHVIDGYLVYCNWVIGRIDIIHDVTYFVGRELFSTGVNVGRTAIKCGN